MIARLLVSLDAEGLELAPGQTWELEEFIVQTGPDRDALLDALCDRVEKNQPRRKGFSRPADRLVLLVLLRAESHGGEYPTQPGLDHY